MAFICTAGGSHTHAEYFRDRDDHSVLVRVGYDDSEPYNYFVQIGLSMAPGGIWEYYFCIVRVNGRTKEKQRYFSGLDASRFIPRADRAAILGVVCLFTESILNITQPKEVNRCTFDSNQPKEALEKHFLISKVFESCGYQVHTTDSFHGKRYWHMERTGHSDVDCKEQSS